MHESERTFSVARTLSRSSLHSMSWASFTRLETPKDGDEPVGEVVRDLLRTSKQARSPYELGEST